MQAEPEFVDALNNLGIVYLTTGKHDKAVVQFRQCLTKHQENPVAHFNLGIALKNLSRFGEATEELELAIAHSAEESERALRARALIAEMNS